MTTTQPDPTVTVAGDPTNGALPTIVLAEPYVVDVRVEGVAAILFHRWNNEAVAEKAAAAKGSKAKKVDDVESYVWRNEAGEICLPGSYLVGSLVDPRNGAAKYRQDPRSSRKSALDLFRAGVVPLTELAPIVSANDRTTHATQWDYLDARRVTVQRAGITRQRPAFVAGWTASVQLLVNSPEYISPALLLDVLTMAGRLVGLADYRPTYGRYAVTSFDIGIE